MSRCERYKSWCMWLFTHLYSKMWSLWMNMQVGLEGRIYHMILCHVRARWRSIHLLRCVTYIGLKVQRMPCVDKKVDICQPNRTNKNMKWSLMAVDTHGLFYLTTRRRTKVTSRKLWWWWKHLVNKIMYPSTPVSLGFVVSECLSEGTTTRLLTFTVFHWGQGYNRWTEWHLNTNSGMHWVDTTWWYFDDDDDGEW